MVQKTREPGTTASTALSAGRRNIPSEVLIRVAVQNNVPVYQYFARTSQKAQCVAFRKSSPLNDVYGNKESLAYESHRTHKYA